MQANTVEPTALAHPEELIEWEDARQFKSGASSARVQREF